MPQLPLGRVYATAAMVGMNGTGTHPLLMSSSSGLLGIGFRAGASAHAANAGRPFLATVVKSSLLGGLALSGQRGFVSLPEGAQDIGKIVSSASEKLGLGDNQFAAGGFQLALIGGLLAGIRVLGSHAVEYLKKRIVVTAEFDSRDESYSWILLYRERVRPAGSTVATSGAAVENITISTLGRSRELIQSLIMEAQRKFIDRDKARTVIFQADQYGAWRRTKSRPKRPLDTIVMDPKLKNYIVNDAKEFFASESWYAERGLPFRRGLLLYGTPGTGKTSFIHALAGELGLNIYVVNLSSKNLTDDTLSELVSDTPSRCLLLIEDVDAAFVQRESKDAATGITFSGLLNSVDGVSAQEGRMLCMTTNHLDRLDEALIRPGRVDVRARFGKATRSQAQELFIKFFPHPPATPQADDTPKAVLGSQSTNVQGDGNAGESSPQLSQRTESELKAQDVVRQQRTEELAVQFASAIPDQTFSIAQLQGFLMGYKKTPEMAVSHVHEFVRQAGSAEVSGTAKIGYDDDKDESRADPSSTASSKEDQDKQYYWEGSAERQHVRDEKERERKMSLK
ncbi:hypothetical protein BGZ67_000491 [Mortierella alpina]|nr:hypothetical protein BGZ67_000491 [Mortierella alpina]